MAQLLISRLADSTSKGQAFFPESQKNPSEPMFYGQGPQAWDQGHGHIFRKSPMDEEDTCPVNSSPGPLDHP